MAGIGSSAAVVVANEDCIEVMALGTGRPLVDLGMLREDEAGAAGGTLPVPPLRVFRTVAGGSVGAGTMARRAARPDAVALFDGPVLPMLATAPAPAEAVIPGVGDLDARGGCDAETDEIVGCTPVAGVGRLVTSTTRRPEAIALGTAAVDAVDESWDKEPSPNEGTGDGVGKVAGEVGTWNDASGRPVRVGGGTAGLLTLAALATLATLAATCSHAVGPRVLAV
jgi:hypothetical protein